MFLPSRECRNLPHLNAASSGLAACQLFRACARPPDPDLPRQLLTLVHLYTLPYAAVGSEEHHAIFSSRFAFRLFPSCSAPVSRHRLLRSTKSRPPRTPAMGKLNQPSKSDSSSESRSLSRSDRLRLSLPSSRVLPGGMTSSFSRIW
jgi:hypothetical protein